jgi:glucose dehydrogenase
VEPDGDQSEAAPGLRRQPASADDVPRRAGRLSGRQALARRRVQGHPSEKQWGRLAAVNLDTGKLAWKFDTEQPLIGGVLATAGDLVFNGEGNGLFRAFDAQTGKKLWEYQAGAGVNSPAVSYMVGGKQYVAVAAGGNTQLDFKRGNTVLVFSLP